MWAARLQADPRGMELELTPSRVSLPKCQARSRWCCEWWMKFLHSDCSSAPVPLLVVLAVALAGRIKKSGSSFSTWL